MPLLGGERWSQMFRDPQ